MYDNIWKIDNFLTVCLIIWCALKCRRYRNSKVQMLFFVVTQIAQGWPKQVPLMFLCNKKVPPATQRYVLSISVYPLKQREHMCIWKPNRLLVSVSSMNLTCVSSIALCDCQSFSSLVFLCTFSHLQRKKEVVVVNVQTQTWLTLLFLLGDRLRKTNILQLGHNFVLKSTQNNKFYKSFVLILREFAL